MTHEDERRVLESWQEAKIITAKENCVLGDHYHKVKTEKFILSSGSATIRRDGTLEIMEIGKIETVEPNVRHSFKLTKGSVLIGLCSHPYDSSDDYK
jgi:quercetin dioxygenase-like cupin family protein